MYLRIYTAVCCAILFGFAAAAQTSASGQHNSEFIFNDDRYIDPVEGSANGGEVKDDLEESSGSGFGGLGPDDEDTPIKTHVYTSVHTDQELSPPRKSDVSPNLEDTVSILYPTQEPAPRPTEDTSVVMNPKSPEDRHTPFFAQPGILAAVIGGAVVGLLCAILVVMFIVYRMRKKDEGSYALGEPKQSPTATSYSRGNNKEFYA